MGYWSRKHIGTITRELEGQKTTLKRTLGPIDLMLLGIGAIVGAGLFSITGIAAAENAGPAIVISFVIAAIGCAFSALCYSELATMIPVSGSVYTYSYVAFGEVVAWLIGWTLVLEYALGASAVAISWSAYLTSFLADFNLYLPSWLAASPWQPVVNDVGVATYGIINFPAVAIVSLVSWILIKGVKESAFINAIIVFIKMTIVILFIAVGAYYINPDNYIPFIPENTGVFGQFGLSGIMRASGVVFFAYIGFDAVSTAVQETKKPQTAAPIGILGSLLVCTILYVLFSFVMCGMVNYKSLDVAAPVALAIDQTHFHFLNWLVKLGILAGFTSVILVLLLGQSRIFYTMSRDGLLPKFFSDLHPRFRTPWKSNLILLLFVGVFGAFAPLSFVGHLTSIGTLLAFALVCIGVLILRYLHPELPRPFKTPLVPIVPILGLITCLLMMAFLNAGTWVRLIVWLLIGLLIYVFYGQKNASLVREKSTQ